VCRSARVGGLDFPPLVIQANQRLSRVGAVIGQGGDQPVAAGDAGAVRAGHGHLGLDDPHIQAIQARQV
jgi:hypothetical protein